MFDNTLHILVMLSLFWAVGALIVQIFLARGGGRRDFSARSGSPIRGVLFAFTTSMTPAHKESLQLHRFEFAVGLLMHLGVALSLITLAVVLLGSPRGLEIVSLAWPLLALTSIAGLFLFIRRMRSPILRAMSVPDDFLANLATVGLMVAASLAMTVGEPGSILLLTYSIAFLAYLPLGKLRHVVFFFIARGDLGRRLGYRGVYPSTNPARAE